MTFHCSNIVNRLDAALSALEAGDIDAAKEAAEQLLEAFGGKVEAAEVDEAAGAG